MRELNVRIHPYWEKDTIGKIAYTFRLEGGSGNCAEADKPLLQHADEAFGGLCPFPETKGFRLFDESGPLSFHIQEIPSWYSGMKCFGYFPERPAAGDVIWQYEAYPRILPEGYRSSPYYDFRSEPGGLNGSGFFSLILPAGQETFQVDLSWEMEDMPAGSRGIFSFGEGTVKKQMSAFQLGFSLFDVGLLHAVESDAFGVYWFGDPGFAVEPVARRLLPIFDYEKNHFGDPDAHFRVFLRRDPFKISNGGSACRYAFISGYSAFGGFDPDQWFNVLIHEMTHTWPYMDDTKVGTGTWFTEGAVEYYCTLLPWQGGFVDEDFTLKCLNDKITKRYYRNPFRNVPNMEIPAIQWRERQAQTVPYGRGFIYLANVQAALKRTGNGTIDDIVRQFGWDRPMQPEDWKAFVRARLGEKAVTEFEDMTDGKLIIPDPDIFDGCFETVQEEIVLNGKKVPSWHWEKKGR